MKTKKFEKKLVLKIQTIAALNQRQMDGLKGGVRPPEETYDKECVTENPRCMWCM
jgi:hypothetical protein